MQSIHKEILKEYDRERLEAQNLLDTRRNDVYSKIPRIKEIDDEIKKTGLKVVKIIMEKNDPSVLNDLKEFNEVLQLEKESLLKAHGIPLDYFTNIYKCMKCKDTGFINNQRCSCYRQKMVNRLYDASSLANVLEVENFENFDFRLFSDEVFPEKKMSPLLNMQRIYEKSMTFIEKFDKSFVNLMFYGDTGLGKTFLCNCIAKEILDRGHTVLYRTAPQMFRVIETYRFNREELDNPKEYMDSIYNSDLLIIDDLGTEITTSIIISELFNILNTRLVEKKSTIISTNLNLGDFEDQYNTRIVSRIFGNYDFFYFFGSDIRSEKKEKKFRRYL